MTYYPIGTRGIASQDLRSGDIFIPRGTIVTIVHIDEIAPSWGYSLQDDFGNRVSNTGFDSIIPTVVIGQTGTAAYDLKTYDFEKEEEKIIAKKGAQIKIVGFSYNDDSQQIEIIIKNLDTGDIIMSCKLSSIKPY